MSSFIYKRIQYSFVLNFGVLLVSSCSSFSEPNTDGTQLPADNGVVGTDSDNVTTDAGTPVVEDEVDDGTEDGNASEMADDNPLEASSESETETETETESTSDVTKLSIPNAL